MVDKGLQGVQRADRGSKGKHRGRQGIFIRTWVFRASIVKQTCDPRLPITPEIILKIVQALPFTADSKGKHRDRQGIFIMTGFSEPVV